MNIEWDRLKSFEKFPFEPSVSFIRLAQGGFFYDGQGEKVVCFCCHATYTPKCWTENVRDIHKALSPACVFVNNGKTNNVPIHTSDFRSNTENAETEYNEHTSGAWSELGRLASGGPHDCAQIQINNIPYSKRMSGEEILKRNHTHSSERYIENITAENENLRSEIMCKICMDRDACVVFLPCGHMATCEVCSKALRKCAMCRAVIRRTIKSIIY
ncbi:hypothetical protein DPMN_180906 [Dreissena polymorpha]|uniref:RING-type domain-containing protein n=1 Tax=Dreissena polymorpha TaxID=45954 RepID=A0A9D4I3T9_DREPO|nr:hypothetical protein DPMN_180906 [Dreissena polymorpha]